MSKLHPSLLAFVLGCSGQVAQPIPPPSAPDASTSVIVDVSPIVQGIPDQGRDPFVVAIQIDPQHTCSGVVLASNVVLTARSCTVTLDQSPLTCPAAGGQVEGDLSPSTLSILTGDSLETATVVAQGQEIVAPLTGVLCDEDIAAVIVGTDLGINPVKLSKNTPTAMHAARTVGFDNSGNKILREWVELLAVSPTEIEIGEATCKGDIGGPAFDESGDGLIGIVSRSGSVCDGEGTHNIYSRVDVHQDLIDAALQEGIALGSTTIKAAAKPDTDFDLPCASAADCSTGICVEPTPGSGYCSHWCTSLVTCPKGFHCTAEDGDKFCFAK